MRRKWSIHTAVSLVPYVQQAINTYAFYFLCTQTICKSAAATKSRDWRPFSSFPCSLQQSEIQYLAFICFLKMIKIGRLQPWISLNSPDPAAKWLISFAGLASRCYQSPKPNRIRSSSLKGWVQMVSSVTRVFPHFKEYYTRLWFWNAAYITLYAITGASHGSRLRAESRQSKQTNQTNKSRKRELCTRRKLIR